MISLLQSKLWLSLYHPPYQNDAEAIPRQFKQTLLLVSLEDLEKSRPLVTKECGGRWAWIFRSFLQWHAIAYLLAGLCQKRQNKFGQEFVSRAWKQLDYVFEGRYSDAGKNVTNGKVWIALTRLYARAKSVQDVQLHQHGDVVCGSTPNCSPTNTNDLSSNSNNSSNTNPVPNLSIEPFPNGDIQPTPTIPPGSQQNIETLELLKDPRPHGQLPAALFDPISYEFGFDVHDSDQSVNDHLSASNFPRNEFDNVDWLEWDGIMRNFQYDLNGNICS